MVCYRTDAQVRSCKKRCDCSKRVQRQNRSRIKQLKIWLLRKSYILLKVESMSVCRGYCKNLFREANRDILDFVSATSLSVSTGLSFCQSLKRNGYSWRKKAERREEPRKIFRENESNLFFTIRGQCIHGYFILYKHRALQLFREIYLPIWARLPRYI